jgi:dTDP-glucose 4,6-dehydratase
MNVLITGILGVIGSALEREFRNRNVNVFGCDLEHTSKDRYMRVDIADFREMRRVIKTFKPDIVYNAAAEFGRWNGEDYYEQLYRTNFIGTKNIIRLSEEYGFKIVHFSSSEIYCDYDGIMTEDVPDKVVLIPFNDYAASKRLNEYQLTNSRKAYDTDYVIVRPFNLYGEEPYTPYRSVACRFCYHALTSAPITVHRGHKRSSLYIDDAVRTLANIIYNFKPGGVYNLGDATRTHTIEELADIIWRCTGADPCLIKYADPEPMTTLSKITDTKRAEQDLGHEVTVSLEDGIEKTVSWMEKKYGLIRPRNSR